VALRHDSLSIGLAGLANLLPLGLAAAGFADAPMVLLIYWGELGVVGLYAALRWLFAAGRPALVNLRDAATYLVVYLCSWGPLAGFLATFYGIGINAVLVNFPREFWIACAGFAGSHGVEFVRGYLMRGRQLDENALLKSMAVPLGLILLMIPAAAVADEFKVAPAVAVALVVLKTAAELALRLRRRKRETSET